MKRLSLGAALDQVLKRIIELGLQKEPICYQASEAIWRLCGGKPSGLKAMRIPFKKGECHWFLGGPNGEIIDVTAGQFKRPPSYRRAKGAAFYPTQSNLSRRLMCNKKHKLNVDKVIGRYKKL